MNTIDDVADYAIRYANADDDDISLSNLKLQKLLYYIQAWSYGINERPIFDGAFQAWVHVPTNVDLFHRFKNKGKTLYSEITLADIQNINPRIESDEDKEVVDLVLHNYLKYSGADLERIAHSEKPWRDARGNCGIWERCETEITPESMIQFYGARWKQINGHG